MTEVSGQMTPARSSWIGGRTQVANPGLLAIVAVATFVAGLFAVISLICFNQALNAQPRTIKANAAASLSSTLELADWASSGGKGPAIYVVGFPTCPNCAVFKKAELPKMLAAGLDVRAIEFAPRRPDDADVSEEARAAEISRSRSWATYMAVEDFYPSSTTSDVAYVERGRATVAAIEADLKASRTAIAFPAFFWRKPGAKENEWRFVLGSSPAATKNILAELRTPSS